MPKFIGPSYRLRVKRADVQRSVNLYPVAGEVAGGKSYETLQSVPGLDVFALPNLLYTSWPYPYEAPEALLAGLAVPLGGYLLGPLDMALDAGLSIPQTGALDVVLVTYGNWPPEAIDAGLSIPQTGALDVILVTYSNGNTEALDAGLSIPQTGALDVVLVTYSNWPAETFDAGLSIPQSGTLA